jgi:hypothetical protein
MDLLTEAYQRGRTARRHATAMSILDVGATVGIFVGCLFWNIIFWRLIAPGDVLEMLLSVSFAGAYAIVLPMLLSLLAPSTPAGMLLAETRWRTIGHAVALAATIFMGYHAFTIVLAWWQARPAIVQTGQDLWMTIGALIIFIVVPALSWVQIAPDRWVAEIVQAQQVKRLKAAQQANLMAAQIQYARAMALLKRGLANATAAERAELAGTLIAMQRAENEAIAQVADQMGIITGADTGVRLLDDPQIEQHYHQLTDHLERLIAPINDRDYDELPPLAAPATLPPPPSAAPLPGPAAAMPQPRGARQDAIPAVSPPASAAAEDSAAAAGRRDSRRYAAEFRAVADAFPPPTIFTAKMVAENVGKSDRTARDMIGAWLDAGWVMRGGAANSYYITRRD